MPDTIRTFIAIELPENIISAIRNVQEGLRSYRFKVRWVRPENIHLTLKFLGNINISRINLIGRTISGSVKDYAPLALSVRGAGVFPGIKRPRVIWTGISGQVPELIALQQTLDENLETVGFPREKRAFKGHLTLGRAKGIIDPKKLNDALKKFNDFETEPFVIDRVFLFKSDLQPTGSIYTKLMSTALTASV
ncbi:RNA 2',3'-cyclic phosphodiesterase [Thermodesulfobacteriota bacterium]